MARRSLLVVALVASLVLAGCAGVGPGLSGSDDGDGPAGDPTGTDDTTTASTPGTTTTETTTTTEQPTTTTTTETTTTQEPYSEPQPPNSPTEDKIEGRIESVEFVNTVEGSDGGYSNFDVRVTANSTMEDVDPPEHGDVEGEPYFLIYINGELVERSRYVAFEDEGSWGIEVHPDGIAQFEPGELEITVQLVDRDSTYDDIYGEWNGTVEYSPAESGS